MNVEQQIQVQPVHNRIGVLDALRGFALLGIYISIIQSFNGSILFEIVDGPKPGRADAMLGQLESLLINKRFIGMLSLLFGIGIAIQQLNFERKGVPFASYFIGRMLILGGLGVVNTTFFFSTEILMVYAVFGLVTLAASRAKTSIIIAFGLFAFLIWGQVFEIVYRDRFIESFAWTKETYSFLAIKDLLLAGSYVEAIKLRWVEYYRIYGDNATHLGTSLFLITGGYLIGIRQLHTKFIENLAKFRPLFLGSLVYTVVMSLYCLARGESDFYFAWSPVAYVFYAPFLLTSMFVYVYLICLAYRATNGENWILKTLTRNGRMSLSGYMGGAMIYALIFYKPGLGLFGQLNRTELAGVALATYVLFSLFAAAWFARFRRGPIEWVFRRLSYGRLNLARSIGK